MVAIKRHKVLLDQSTAGNGDWVRLDSRYDCDSTRSIQIELTSGDQIDIEVTSVDVRGGDPATVLAGLAADDISVLSSYTAD